MQVRSNGKCPGNLLIHQVTSTLAATAHVERRPIEQRNHACMHALYVHAGTLGTSRPCLNKSTLHSAQKCLCSATAAH